MRALTSSYAGRKAEKETVQTAVDRTYQRSCKNEWPYPTANLCMALKLAGVDMNSKDAYLKWLSTMQQLSQLYVKQLRLNLLNQN